MWSARSSPWGRRVEDRRVQEESCVQRLVSGRHCQGARRCSALGGCVSAPIMAPCVLMCGHLACWCLDFLTLKMEFLVLTQSHGGTK